MLHRLNISLHQRHNEKIRITFLARKTKFRRILNEVELIAELRKNDSYIVRSVTYERYVTFIFSAILRFKGHFELLQTDELHRSIGNYQKY